MANKKINLTQEELNAVIAQAVAQALAAQAPTKSASKPAQAKGKAKTATFTKHDGTKVACTPAQKQAWTKYRDGYETRVASKEANLAQFEADRKAFKPSKALKDALKANPTMTRKEAKAYGFVGTSNDLWNLKYGKNGCIRKGTFDK